MRKYIILPLLLICFVLLCACSESKPNVDVDTGDETTVNIPDTTDISDTTIPDVTVDTTPDTNDIQNSAEISDKERKEIAKGLLVIKNQSPDGMHKSAYFDSFETEGKWFVDESAYSEFIEMTRSTMSCSMAGFIDYFGISKEEYVDTIEEKTADWDSSTKAINWPIFKCAELFWDNGGLSDTYYKSNSFMVELWEYPGESVTVRPNWPEYDEGQYKYTSIYHTIDFRLIEYVGKDYKGFYDKYAGGMDFNIVNFIEYFDISKEEYIKIIDDFYEKINWYFTGIRKGWCIYPYNPDYLYGTEEMREQYFCRHPELLLSNQEQAES